MSDFANVKFSNNSIDLQVLREFCEREGEAVSYRKGDQMERDADLLKRQMLQLYEVIALK